MEMDSPENLSKFNKSSNTFLANFVFDDPGKSDPNASISVGSFSEAIHGPKTQKLRNGYCRRSDGSLYVAAETPMLECTGEMFEWWFSYCDSAEKYLIWHPRDHVHGHWCEEYNRTPLLQRKRGHYIGKSHIVEEHVGGELQKLRIDFKDPSEYVDVSEFERHSITACLCARVHVKEGLLGYLAVGHMIHIFQESEEGSQLHSHFWLGDIHSTGLPISSLVNLIGNTKAFRKMRASQSMAFGLLKHCIEEMSCLARFLPQLYEEYDSFPKTSSKALNA